MPMPALVLLALLSGLFSPAPSSPAPERASLNDNLTAAGDRSDGALALALRIVETDWRPNGAEEPGAIVYAFAEAGGSPSIPGPLLRVPLGTTVRAVIENTVSEPFVVQGLSTRLQADLDVVRIEPGERAVVEFTADAEGTYHYWGAVPSSSDEVPDIRDRFEKDALLGGAFVVDPAEGPAPDDRIFMLNVYGHRFTPETPDEERVVLLTINGRPWPHTERLAYDTGDTIRWRLINASERGHPMHLHGFFFEVEAKGDLTQDTLYWPSQRRMAVTEDMAPGSTFAMSWVPDRPGGWIFHCHISFHVSPNARLGTEPQPVTEVLQEFLFGNPDHDPDHHVEQGMGGLMMAVNIRPPEGWTPDMRARRALRLLVQSDSFPAPEGANPFEFAAPYRRQFAFVLDQGSDPAPDSVHLPGSTLVLHKDEPTSIWVVNRTAEPTSVHWHGLELESFFDGVVGVGGTPGMPTPAVMPGDSFEVRITPPRAGSFMYHTHISDLRQQSAGLYGPIVILDSDAEWDTDHDRVMLLGLSPEEPGVFLNGSNDPEPMEMVRGETYRLRLMNITLANGGARVRMLRNGDADFWTPIAKDGHDLPSYQQRRIRADQVISVGETMDLAFTPRGGEYVLEVRGFGGNLFVRQEVRVSEGSGPG